MSSLAECMNLGHQHPAVDPGHPEQAERALLRDRRLGRRTARAARRAPAREVRLRGRPRLLHARRRRRQRARGEVRPPGDRQAARVVVITRDRSLPRRQLRARWPSAATAATWPPGRRRRLRRRPRAAPLRLPLPVRLRLRRGVRERSARRTSARRSTRTAPAGGRGPDGAGRGHQRHRRAGHATGPACARRRAKRGVYLIADEVMSGFGRCGEWFAWQRYGEAGRPGPDDPRQGADRRAPAARRGGALARGRGPARARDALHRPHLLRPPARVRRRRRRHPGLRGRGAHRAFPRPWARGCSSSCAAMQDRHAGHRRRARRPRPVRGAGTGEGPRHARAGLRPWPDVHPALDALVARGRDAGVSFAVRGNLILLAPPLVIREADLARARSPCWIASSRHRSGHDLQAHLLHDVRPARGDARPLRGGARGGAVGPRRHPRDAHRRARRRRRADLREAQPDRPARACWATSPSGTRRDVDRAMAAAKAAFDGWRRTPTADRAARSSGASRP